MSRSAAAPPDFSARLSFWLLSALLVILWIAGGASRADVLGQGVVRFFAWTFLIAFTLFAARFAWRTVRPVAIFLGLAIIVVALQLVPLPPAIWMTLPGRELLMHAAEVIGQPQPWRPLSISPGATVNALGSLVVPAVVLILCAQLNREQYWRIAALLLALIFAGCLLALLQFSGASFDNPFINYNTGSVSGNFANRNHFALFVAWGCLIAPILGFRGDRPSRWKAIASVALIPFLLLVILATGSRAGIVLGVLAIFAGFFLIRGPALRELRLLPRWGVFALVGALSVGLIGAVILAFTLGRAVALDRALELEAVDDLRSRALPYVLEALWHFFPAGAGFGTFDPVYRIGEPDALLQHPYFNHAHNDWVEVVLDGGLAGAALLLGGIGWMMLSIMRLWRRKRQSARLAWAGATALILTMLASVLDYPARTPMIMAAIIIFAVWLNSASRFPVASSQAS